MQSPVFDHRTPPKDKMLGVSINGVTSSLNISFSNAFYHLCGTNQFKVISSLRLYVNMFKLYSCFYFYLFFISSQIDREYFYFKK